MVDIVACGLLMLLVALPWAVVGVGVVLAAVANVYQAINNIAERESDWRAHERIVNNIERKEVRE